MRIKDDAIPPKFSDGKDRAVYLLAEYKIGVMLVALAVLALFLSGRWQFPELPEWVGEWLTALAMGIIPAMVISKVLVVDKFIPDPRLKILELRPDKDESMIETSTYRVPRDVWEERKHYEGLPVLEPDGDVDCIVTQYEWDDDLSQLRVRGCNEEVADPVSIIASNGKLDKIFNDLLESEQELQDLRSTLHLKQHEIEKHVVNSLVAAVEHGVSFDGAGDIISEEVWGDDYSGPREKEAVDPADDPEILDPEEIDGQTATATDGGSQL